MPGDSKSPEFEEKYRGLNTYEYLIWVSVLFWGFALYV